MTEKAKKQFVKAKTALRAVKPAVKVCATVDENLKKLAKSTIPMNFVKKHNGVWNHQDWLDFLAEIQAKGYDPVDPDKVGLILEDRKSRFFGAGK